MMNVYTFIFQYNLNIQGTTHYSASKWFLLNVINNHACLFFLSQPSDILQLSFTTHRGPLAASSCFTSWLLPCLVMIALRWVGRGLCLCRDCQEHRPMFPCLPSCRSCSLDNFPDAQKKRQVNMRTVNLYSIMQHDGLQFVWRDMLA